MSQFSVLFVGLVERIDGTLYAKSMTVPVKPYVRGGHCDLVALGRCGRRRPAPLILSGGAGEAACSI
jgi:hypothetical protein